MNYEFTADQLQTLSLYLPKVRIDQLRVELAGKATADEAFSFARDAVQTAKSKRENAWMYDASKSFSLGATTDGEITL